MRPELYQRKWEIDSLCYCIRLAHGYWRATGDTAPFDIQWSTAMRLVLGTFREQQRKAGQGSYHFQRRTEVPTDTQALGGYGNPARSVGLIYSMFRPSDDACVYSLFVPANLFAVVSLRQLSEMAGESFHVAAGSGPDPDRDTDTGRDRLSVEDISHPCSGPLVTSPREFHRRKQRAARRFRRPRGLRGKVPKLKLQIG